MESFHVSTKRKWLFKSTGDVSEVDEKKKPQTALGSGGQSVHGNRAVASAFWQVLLFAEASHERVRLHRPVSPAVTGGTWRPL